MSIWRTNNPQYLKDLREKAAAEGRCYVCRCRPQKIGSRSCEQCLALTKVRKRKLADQDKCCCGARTYGKSRCASCMFVSSTLIESLRMSEWAAGNCWKCYEPREYVNRTQCNRCLDGDRIRNRKRGSRRRSCTVCGNAGCWITVHERQRMVT